MTHSRSLKLGMSFIEVIVALMLVSIVFIATFKTQMVMLRTAAKTSTLINAVAALEEYFMQASRDKFLEKETHPEKIIEFPAMKLTYKSSPAKDSSVFKNIDHIMVEKVTATWEEVGREQSLEMVRFTYKAPEQKEDKKTATVQGKGS